MKRRIHAFSNPLDFNTNALIKKLVVSGLVGSSIFLAACESPSNSATSTYASPTQSTPSPANAVISASDEIEHGYLSTNANSTICDDLIDYANALSQEAQSLANSATSSEDYGSVSQKYSMAGNTYEQAHACTSNSQFDALAEASYENAERYMKQFVKFGNLEAVERITDTLYQD